MRGNCLFEAIKAKIKDPKNVSIHLIPPSLNHGYFHFYWLNKKEGRCFHYTEDAETAKSLCARFNIFFNGVLKSSWDFAFEAVIFKKNEKSRMVLKKTNSCSKKIGVRKNRTL